jgi:hypothetical protein
MQVDQDAIKVRLEALKESTSRSRYALLAATIAAISMLVAEFNSYISWNRDFAFMGKLAKEGGPTRVLQDHMLESWSASTNMEISLLGIKVSSSDATILGGMALFFLTLWLFYSVRRENRLVGTLLRDTRDVSIPLMDLAYSGTISYMVLTAIHPRKRRIITLSDDDKKAFDEETKAQGMRSRRFFGVQLLFFLPPLAIGASIAFDVISLHIAAPFRESHVLPPMDDADLHKFYGYTIAGGLGLALTLYNCIRVQLFDSATGSVIREYFTLFKGKRLIQEALGGSAGGSAMVSLFGFQGSIESGAAVVSLEFSVDDRRWDMLAKNSDFARKFGRHVAFLEPPDADNRRITCAIPSARDQVSLAVNELARLQRVASWAIADMNRAAKRQPKEASKGAG